MIQYNGLTLAYIGDAIYELRVRMHLLNMNLTKVNDLHNNAIRYTSATQQATVARLLVEHTYTEEEIGVFKRGRNQNSSHKPKNADVLTYNVATGFEAVIGYLYLEGRHDRLEDLLSETFKIIEEL